MTILSELSESEYDPYYGRYIGKLPATTELIDHFNAGRDHVVEFFRKIPENKHLFRYQEGKWTIKEILQHLIDTERVFIYRCFRIARRDTTLLAGFNQEIYIPTSGANDKEFNSLMDEFMYTRAQSISILESLSGEDLKFLGNANQGKMSARAAAFVIIGHEIWHMEIIREKYL